MHSAEVDMLTVLYALSGCVWVSEEAHQERIKDTVSITLDGAPSAFGCAPAEFTVGVPFVPPAGTEFSWDLNEGSAQGAGMLDASAAETVFSLPAAELERACETASCTVPLTVRTRLRGVDTTATLLVDVVRRVEVSLSSDGTPLIDLATPPEPPDPVDPLVPVLPQSAVFVGSVDEVDVAVVGALAFGGALLLCPLGDPESPECLRSEFSSPEAVARTEPLDLCPEAVLTTVGWQLYVEIVPDSCDVPLPIVTSDVLRFLSSDCDQDGVLNVADCDDLDPDVNDPVPLYPDTDADGYHGGERTRLFCGPSDSVPAGLSDLADDCDDNNMWVNPGVVVDDCDQVDSNCTGSVDSDGENAPGFGLDADQDGYGQNEVPTEGWCGFYTLGFDCDDTDADIHPGAVEDYSNLIDEDCDGRVRCDTLACEPGAEHRVLPGIVEGVPVPFNGIGVSRFLDVAPAATAAIQLPGPIVSVVATHATSDGLPDLLVATSAEVFVVPGANQPLVPFVVDSQMQGYVVDVVAGFFNETDNLSNRFLDQVVVTTHETEHFVALDTIDDTYSVQTASVDLGLARRALAGDVDGVCGDEVIVFSDEGLKVWHPDDGADGGVVDGYGGGSYDDGFIADVDQDGLADVVAWGSGGLDVFIGPSLTATSVITTPVAVVAASSNANHLYFATNTTNAEVFYVELDSTPVSVYTFSDPDVVIRSLAAGRFNGIREDLVMGTASATGRDSVLLDAANEPSAVLLSANNTSVRSRTVDINNDGFPDVVMENDGLPDEFLNLPASSDVFLSDNGGLPDTTVPWKAQVTAPIVLISARVPDPRSRLSLPDCLNERVHPPAPVP